MDSKFFSFMKNRMIQRAMILGIIAAGISIFMPTAMYLSIGLGCLSILFVILSKTDNGPTPGKAKVALATAIPAVGISVLIIALVMLTLKFNTTYRNNVGELIDEVYGDTFEELYGESFTDTLNDLFGERNE